MENAIKIDDFFNETDSDTDRQVIGLRTNNGVPVVVSRPFAGPGDSSDESTEEEYVLEYAKKRYVSHKAWCDKGYHEYDVRDIYKLSRKQLVEELSVGQHTTTGTKKQLCYRFMSINGLCDVPSDGGRRRWRG